jgi:tetratricopeptide (TPR) repeat protein
LNERFHNSEYFIKSVLALATFESGSAEWKELHPDLEKVIEICTSLGDQRQIGEALSFLSCNALLEGNVQLAEQYHSRMLKTVQNHSTQMTWYYSWSGALLLRLGKFDEGLEYTKQELALLEKTPIGDENVDEASRMYANALWHIGDQDSALMKAKELLIRAQSVQAVKYTSYVGFSQAMDVIILGLERAYKENRSQAEKDELMTYAKLSVKIMKPYARVFTVGRPFLHRYKAWVEWYSGKREKAYRSWRRACEEAHALPMHYEEGISSLELADHLLAGNKERHVRYEQARDAFVRGGFDNWVAEVDSRLMGTVAGG